MASGRYEAYAIQDKAQDYYQGLLWADSGKDALAYMRDRGFSDETLRRFGVGYAPGGSGLVDYLSSRHRVHPQAMEEAGLAVRGEAGRYIDRFKCRVLFPILDTYGDHVAGFGGRALDDHPAKYLNTPSTRAFEKGSLLYAWRLALPHARRLGTVVVVEGYMDTLACHQQGCEHVVASMGTALTKKQIALARQSRLSIVLALDGDESGARAVERSLRSVVESGEAGWASSSVRVAELPVGSDPCDVALRDPALWADALARARPALDAYVDRVLARESGDRTAQFAALLPAIAYLPDREQRARYLEAAAERWHIAPRLLESAAQLARSVPGTDDDGAACDDEALDALGLHPMWREYSDRFRAQAGDDA